MLVGGLEHDWIIFFDSVGNVIIPTDELIYIFQRGCFTTNQYGSNQPSLAIYQPYINHGIY